MSVIRLILLLVLGLTWGCDSKECLLEGDGMVADSATDFGVSESESRLLVFQTLVFAGPTSDGVTPGFDLDERISEPGDRENCGHGDFVSPEGTPGIDNQLAILVPLFNAVGFAAAQTLLQSAITEGGILFMLQVNGIDSYENDDEVELVFRAGQGNPLLGTDGLLLSGQTFDLSAVSPETVVQDGFIRDGELHAGPFETVLPFVIYGVQYELRLKGARVKARWTDELVLADGVVGAAVSIDNLIEIGELAAQDDPSVLRGIEVLVGNAGDLDKDEDGICQSLSASLTFGAVSAYLFDESD